MVPLAHDLEILRSEERILSRRLARFRFLRLLLLSLLVVGLWLGLLALPSTEIPVLEVDLLDWMYAVPIILFLFITSEVYRQILSKKSSLLKLVAAYRLQTASAEEAPTVEVLRFPGPGGQESTFVRHPGDYIRWLQRFWLLLLVYLLLHVIVSEPPWQHDSELFWQALWVSGLVGTLGIYAAAYIRYACRQLEAEVAAMIEWTPPVPWTARQWDRGRRLVAWVRARLRPRVSLSTGSVLILLTLVLPLALSEGNCGPTDEPGYKLITGADGTFWYSSYLLGDRGLLHRRLVKASVNELGRSLYALAASASLLTLLLVFVERIRGSRWLRDSRLLRAMSALTGTIALFALADYASLGLGALMFGVEPGLLWVCGWLVPVILWLRFALSSEPSAKARWPRLRSRLVVFYLPLVLSYIGLMLLFVLSLDMWGLPVYLVGVLLLASGYLRLAADQAVAEAEQTASLASGSHAGAVEGDPEEAHHVRDRKTT
jgi:hypothetical protein